MPFPRRWPLCWVSQSPTPAVCLFFSQANGGWQEAVTPSSVTSPTEGPGAFIRTLQLILPLRATGVGAHKATLEEDAGIRRRRPRHGRSTRQEKARPGPSPPRQVCQCWGCRRHGREDGVPSGESGVCLPLFLSLFSPFSLTETHTPYLLRSFLSFLSHKHTGNYSVCLCGLPHSPSPTPLICSGICGTPALPPEMPKMGT